MSGVVEQEIGASRAETLIADDKNGEDVLEIDSIVRVTGTCGENEKNEGKDDVFGNGGSFGVSDLVWGKVRSHPWWPGQIFDPLDASEEARKRSKKDGFLIAYFGDRTFAWNEAATVRPFREHFVSMEKQSKTESFCHAVECALGEVSRRVEFGLACKCLSEEVYDQIKTQSIVNAGIQEESSRREGGDGYSNGTGFVPFDLVGYVQSLAKSPCGETDRLDFVVARAQLLSFNRHRGFPELPQLQFFDGFLRDGVECVTAENNGDVPLENEMGTKGSSRKRKKTSSNPISPSEKEINMSDLTSKSVTRLSVKKRKVDASVTDSRMVEERRDSLAPVIQEQFSDVGKCICSVITALKDGGNGNLLSSSHKKAGRKKAITAEYPSPHEILSHLRAAARDPINGCSSLCSSISFFSDMRNLSSLEKSEHEKASDESSTKEGGKELPKEETVVASGVEGFEDSYWTDRVVISDPQEQVLFEPETLNGNVLKLEAPHGNMLDPTSDVETANHVVEKCDEEINPTALILNFTDIESVPSQSNLNNIFRRYGPLNETGTEIVKKSKRAKVIFKRRSDAETAFSSSGKFSIFGPSLVSYRLHYLPVKKDQGSPAKKRSRKVAKSVEGNDG